jgi:signal transduction histidine kinase/ligand-binding sensor domain-containing protein
MIDNIRGVSYFPGVAQTVNPLERDFAVPRRSVAATAGALVCMLLAWCSSACALDPSLDISQYAHTAWTFRNGFLNGAVYALAQAPDGYLWLGTQTGVYRFDGVRAVPLPLPGLGTTEVGTLLPARDGTLWIGTLDGLVSSKNGQLNEHPSLGRRRVNALLEDRDGTVWAGTALGGSGRLCAIRTDGTQCYGEDGRLGSAVQSLYEGSDGSLWVAARNGLWRWKPDPPVLYLATPVTERQSLAQGDQGSVLVVAVGDGSIRQLTGAGVTDYPVPGLPSSLDAARVLRDRHGGLWIGTHTHGILHVMDGKTSRFTHTDGLSSDQVKALFEDREGTIWVGTAEGLDRFHELAVTSLSADEGLSGANARSVLAARDGSLWIAMADGLFRWKEGKVSKYPIPSSAATEHDEIQSLFEDEQGRIWVAAYSGLLAFAHGKLTRVPAVPVGATFAIAADNHRGLWLSVWPDSGSDGLMHLLDGKIIEQVPGQKLGGGPGTGGLVPDRDGGVWLGLYTGGLSYYRDGRVRNIPLTDRPNGSVEVLDLSLDRDGAVWAATANGLTRIRNGRIATLSTANGLPCNKIHWMIDDDASAYWLYTQCGLLRVARTELDAWAADPKRTIQVTTYDAADGIRLVPTLSGMHPQVAKSSNGKIWFVNYDTVSFFDPARMTRNTLAPPVHVEQVTADHRTYLAKPGLRLPPLVRDLSIDYTALSLVAPEKVHFKYKLEGQDLSWREVVNEREARYSNLAPGTYRFRVIASNNSGVWNDAGAALDFMIAPAYWQTLWFRAVCGTALLGVLVLLYWLRVRQLAHAFNMKLDARVEERTRIARDLHDTMLQNFQGVLLQLRAALRFLEREPAKAREVLTSAIDQAVQSIKGGRETVQGLRTSARESNDLPGAIVGLGKDLAAAHGGSDTPSVRVAVEGTVRDLHPIVRDEVFRVTAEALRNVFQHSRAVQVEVELCYDAREFRLRVRDDGQGIDPQILAGGGREGHFGLRGMRERAKLAGGKLTLWSAPDSGTEVELLIPGSAAYAPSRSATE